MIYSTQEFLERVKEADSVSVLVAKNDPGRYVAGKLLKGSGIPIYVFDSHFNNNYFSRLKIALDALNKYDLILMFGVNYFKDEIVSGLDNKFILVTDNVNYDTIKYPTYIVNKKNLPWKGIKTTSYTQTAYEIVKTLDKTPPSSIKLPYNEVNLETALLLGDWEDNSEMSMTEFQKEMTESIGLNNFIPNFNNYLGKFALLNFLPAAVHGDIRFVYHYKSKGKHREVTNKFLFENLIVESNLERTLKENIDGINDDLLYFPEIHGKSLIDFFSESFYSKDNISKLKESVINIFLDYNRLTLRNTRIGGKHPISDKYTILNFYKMDAEGIFNIMGFYQLLLLFDKNSALLVNNFTNKGVYSGFFMKSNLNLHAGMISQISSSIARGPFGGGEHYKAYSLIEKYATKYYYITLNNLFNNNVKTLERYLPIIGNIRVINKGVLINPPYKSNVSKTRIFKE